MGSTLKRISSTIPQNIKNLEISLTKETKDIYNKGQDTKERN